MDIDALLFTKLKNLRFQEDAECAGPAAPLAIGLGGVSKDQQCARFHRGYRVCS